MADPTEDNAAEPSDPESDEPEAELPPPMLGSGSPYTKQSRDVRKTSQDAARAPSKAKAQRGLWARLRRKGTALLVPAVRLAKPCGLRRMGPPEIVWRPRAGFETFWP